MRPVEIGAIALGLVAVLSGACSKGGSSSQGSKEPSASNQPPAQTPQAQQQPKTQTPAIGGGPTEPATPKGAVSSLVAAQCDREVRCNNVGQDKKYKTRDECVAKQQHDNGQSINDKVCTGGINQGNLNRCVQALREDECGNPINALQRAESCKTDSICVKHAKKK